MKSKLFILLLSALISCNLLVSQPEKFGKINSDVLKLSEDKDFPDASAIILFDIGNVEIDYVNDEFQIKQERHVRIKIFSKAGYDYANVTLPRYLKGTEKFMKISAIVYNLDEKGKVIKEKVDPDQIFDEDIDNKINRKRFTFPSVKEGSVIEYKYEMVSSKSFRIIDWDFQHEIPVKHSQFETMYPVYFTYLTKYQGNLPFTKRDKNTVQRTYTQKESKNVSLGSKTNGTKREITHTNFDINFKTFIYVMENVPPIVEEPFITTVEDYRAKLIHQYKSYQVPPNKPYIYINDWETLAEKLNENSDFGGQLRLVNTWKKEMNEIVNEGASSVENMMAVYDYVRNLMTWNERYRVFPADGIKTAFNEQEGNSADINLLLTYILQKTGFESYPVLISTKGHGTIDMSIPILSQFNSVINLTIIDGKKYFMDATDPMRPYNLLAENTLYVRGFVLNGYEFSWEAVSNTFKSKELISSTLTLSSDGDLVGVIEASQTGYYALNTREEVIENGKEGFFGKLLSGGEADTEYSIENINFLDDIYKPITYKINIENNSFSIVNDDMIYLKPMMHEANEKNPFKSEKRNYPIDFGFSRDQTFMLNLTIPEGYEVLEMPEPIKIVLPENGGMFYFICKNVGNKIQLNCKLNLSRTKFSVEEYPQIKSFFDIIIAKQAEQIVLKKSAAAENGTL